MILIFFFFFFFFGSSLTGKILDDAKPLEEYKIEEKNFIVVMVTKVILHKCISA